MSADAKVPQDTVASLEERLASIKAQLLEIPQEMKDAKAIKDQQEGAFRAWASADRSYDVEGSLQNAEEVGVDPKGDLSDIENAMMRRYATAHRKLLVELPKKQKDLNFKLVKTQKELGEAVMRGGAVKDIGTMFQVMQTMYIKMKEMQLEIDALKKEAERSTTPEQMNDKGRNYFYGLNGVDKDCTQAAIWFRKSAEQGNAWGQYNLGKCYKKGQGVTKDFEQAVFWFRKSAEQGNEWGQNDIGISYYNGQGVAKDFKQAVFWFRKSADQGNELAQNNLGVCYKNGEGVAKDLKQAVVWYRKSAKQGDDWTKNKLSESWTQPYV